jgi:hypothetical protein
MTELKCDKCESTRLTLLSSKIQGLNRLIDIYFCKNCQHSKIVTTLKNQDNDGDIHTMSVIDTETYIDVPIPDIDEPDYEDITNEPQNPYEDNDGGWDPSIG